MSEAVALRARGADSPQEKLARESAAVAERLAELLDTLGVARERPLADARAFLQRMVETAPQSRRATATPFDRLADALALTRLERRLVVLAGLPDEHEGYASVLRALHPHAEPRATAGLAAQLFGGNDAERAELRAALAAGTAVRSGVLVVEGDRPFFERSLALADALWVALHGVDVWPSGVSRDRRDAPTAGLETWFADEHVARAVRLVAAEEPVTIVVSADSETIALARGAALAAVAGVPAASLLLPDRDDAALGGAVSAHAIARRVVPVVCAPAEPPVRATVSSLAEHPGPVVLCVRTGTAPDTPRRPVLAVAAERTSPADRRRMWRTVLPQLASEAPRLASRHVVEPTIAAASARDVAAIEALEGRRATVDDVAASVRGRAGLSLSSGVKLLRPTAAWDQLVLPEESRRQLRDAAARLVNQIRVLDDWGFLRGRPGARGVRMLFSGPPGTGKTLSAEVLANELGVELLVVDLARVVSKWIGETEKNLAEVFDAAERAEAVLFFDEADALFGKRTEVSDAHDRYANLETAYLLTRLERFEGLAVLATNLRQNVDQAFLRRVEFVVDFEEPTVRERIALWRCHLPAEAPLAEDVDLEELALLYPIVGALIRNAAVAAAFVAASESAVIGRDHLLSAIEREYQKSGRAFPGLPHVVHT